MKCQDVLPRPFTAGTGLLPSFCGNERGEDCSIGPSTHIAFCLINPFIFRDHGFLPRNSWPIFSTVDLILGDAEIREGILGL